MECARVQCPPSEAGLLTCPSHEQDELARQRREGTDAHRTDGAPHIVTIVASSRSRPLVIEVTDRDTRDELVRELRLKVSPALPRTPFAS